MVTAERSSVGYPPPVPGTDSQPPSIGYSAGGAVRDMSLGMNAGKLLQLLRSEDYNAQRPNAWYSAAAIHDISVGT